MVSLLTYLWIVEDRGNSWRARESRCYCETVWAETKRRAKSASRLRSGREAVRRGIWGTYLKKYPNILSLNHLSRCGLGRPKISVMGDVSPTRDLSMWWNANTHLFKRLSRLRNRSEHSLTFVLLFANGCLKIGDVRWRTSGCGGQCRKSIPGSEGEASGAQPSQQGMRLTHNEISNP